MKTKKLKNTPPKKRQVGLYIDPSLHYKVTTKCAKEDTSLTSVITDLLDFWVNKKIRIKKESITKVMSF